jgi:nitrite reductase/ring-hydroxylating ferredoxin subunit
MRLCHLQDLPDGSSRGFDPTGSGRDTVLLVRQGAQVFAYRDACPHVQAAAMAWRKDRYLNAAGTRIVCHAHGAEFDIATGVCTLGPALGLALTPVAVATQPDGTVCLMPHQR